MFHRAGWLLAAAEASHSHLRAMVLAHNDNWVGTVPLFQSRRGPFRVTMSPPAKLGIPYLGPTLNAPAELRQAPKEAKWRELVRAILGVHPQRDRPHYFQMILSPGIQDVRPFLWAGFRTTPAYTYILDLTPPPDAIYASFQREARKRIRTAEKTMTFREGGENEAMLILQDLSRRYREQGLSLGVTQQYVARLFDALPAGSLRSLVVERNGVMVTGLIATVEANRVRVWQGGHRSATPESGAVEYLYWCTALWARTAGKGKMELVGANTPQLVEFKVKFNPSLDVYYLVERASPLSRIALEVRHSVVRRASRRTDSGISD